MKTNKMIQQMARLACLAVLAALAVSSSAHAQPAWQTVLDYQLAAGKGAGGEDIVADVSGNVFSAGGATDAAGTNHVIVLKSDTTQANWYFSDEFNPDPTQYSNAAIWNLGLDANSNVYSIGELFTPATAYWYVRKSSDSGVNWSTVDLYQYTPGQFAYATGFAADDTGNIYVVGSGSSVTVTGTGKHTMTQSYQHWLVRKSSDAGQTWNLVDDVTGTMPNAAGFVPGAGVFVAGPRFPGNSPQGSWLVRRSPTGEPGTWSTVDNPFANARVEGVAGDSQRNVYVTGMQNITVTNITIVKNRPVTTYSSYSLWVTRKSSDGGNSNTWSTVDTFTYGGQNTSGNAWGIGTNAAGNVVVVGNAYDGQKTHWIVRTPDSSGVWNTIDDFQLSPGYSASASGVTTDAAGHLLVTGTANDSTGSHWIVRRF